MSEGLYECPLSQFPSLGAALCANVTRNTCLLEFTVRGSMK